ncbi:RNA polymerase sigma-54 factor [Oxobacter pfennigii]|uniref:RNA polymerase sigma-54 factor n=1 Tax=Oxobacter pfennigii TaxID=36849 RepID=A0A0P8WBE6_9CLOT|nr:RNA polymerase factor sigma-54 [Oxobacter pfennigii]KPU45251.1 RNA polymerase sigma-54 factor [Oxobacter pfennigii]
MKMNFDLSMRQTQKLVMTQQLQMAIKLLQMPSLELNEYIQEQLEDNPVLESLPDEKPIDEPKIDWKEYIKTIENYDYYENYHENDESLSPINFIPSVTTLREHLMFQLHLAVRNNEDVQIGEYIIDNIDGSGYLRADASDIAKHFNIKNEKIEGLIKIIQGFDPVGVGARSITECLILQLREMNMLDYLLEKVINNYLEDIGNNRYNFIAKELSITLKEAQKIGDIIKSLEPKPGRGFESFGHIRYIIPDVVVEKMDGKYMISVNDRMIPALTINSYYKSILLMEDNESKAQDFIKKKMDAAAWLIKSLEQRKNTIYNVVSSIVSFQKDFLDNGLNYLKPLTLKDVAEDIKMHESTVSRAISGKYVQTPRGLYGLKFFFTRGIDVGEDNISSETIKKVIKQIIEKENERRPLSDQKITDILNNQRINIKRRTVAKYREEMNIPPAGKRKRF